MSILLSLTTQAHALSAEECRERAEATEPVQAVAWRDAHKSRWRVGLDGQTFAVYLPSDAGPTTSVTTLQSGESLSIPEPRLFSLDLDADVALIRLVPNCGLGMSLGSTLVASRVEIVSGPDPSPHLEDLEARASRWMRSREARELLDARPSERSRATHLSMWWAEDGVHIHIVARMLRLGSVGCGVQTDKPCSLSYVSREIDREWTRVVDAGGAVTSDQLSEPQIEESDPGNPP